WVGKLAQRRGQQAPGRSRLRLTLEALEDRLQPSTLFAVTTPDDAGPGSLRQAILDANTNPGLDVIAFNIGGGGAQTIRPASALPEITDPVTIDGTTQPGFAGSPLIELNGKLFTDAPGLLITVGNSTIRGLVVNGFSGSEIHLRGASNNLIVGNYLGTDLTG